MSIGTTCEDNYNVKAMNMKLSGYHWDLINYPDFRGVLDTRGSFVQHYHNWDKSDISEVSTLRGVTILSISGQFIHFVLHVIMCCFNIMIVEYP